MLVPKDLPEWISSDPIDDWIETISLIKDKEELREFLELTLTKDKALKNELTKISSRWRAMLLLCDGWRPTQISRWHANGDRKSLISEGVITRSNGHVTGAAKNACHKFYQLLKQHRLSR